MRRALPVGLGASACGALAVLSLWWLPMAGLPHASHAGAAMVATMGWYMAAAGYCAWCSARPPRERLVVASVPLGAWLVLVALFATGLFADTWFHLTARTFWSCQVLLLALLALATASAVSGRPARP